MDSAFPAAQMIISIFNNNVFLNQGMYIVFIHNAVANLTGYQIA
jgi:SLT domain-containing protein